MLSFFRKYIIAALRYVKDILAANPKLQTLLYDMKNEDEFANLYEHEKMLADSERINTYRDAIRKYVRKGDTVLDLGTGTGILSFFAAQQYPGKIYAIDHSEFIGIAKKIAAHNNFTNIEFIKKNSRSFKPRVKFDIIIHEQIGDYLFNENMIQNLLDLKKRLLKPDGRILPGKFELYLEPTCLHEPYNIPFIWENKLYGVDFKFLKNHYEDLDDFKPGDYRQEWLEAAAVNQFLCKPSPIVAFDLNRMKSEIEIPHTFEITKQVIKSGSFDGFCLYFKVIFDDEIHFDTSPLTTYTHWGNCFFRIESREGNEGDIIKYKLTMRDFLNITTWSVSIKRFRKKDHEQT